uniref:Uncharacterized protein n=1 Tax=Rhizophora mucronata TaxID=61149 RepID=A0A2P2IYM3_RHIMU
MMSSYTMVKQNDTNYLKDIFNNEVLQCCLLCIMESLIW